MSIAQSGWRTLAESTYGVSDEGQALMLWDGIACRIVDGRRPNLPGTACLEVDTSLIGMPMSRHWFVTAAALRFEGEELG